MAKRTGLYSANRTAEADEPSDGLANAGWVLRVLRRPIVLGVAFASVLGGASTAAASDWFEVFQSRDAGRGTAGVPELVALSALGGQVDVAGDVTIRDVADARSATAQTGLEAPVVTSLPRGVTGEPAYKVAGEVSVTFTGPDGATIQLEAGPGLAAVWSHPSGLPRLVVARAPVPTATSSGVTLELMRDDRLSIPGLPADVASQLLAFAADLLPLPLSQITTVATEVNGRPATVVVTGDRSFAAAVWAIDGIVTVVAGSLDADEILSVARNLQ